MDILPQKKMQAVLWDMMRADQFLTDYVLNKDSSLNKITESLKYYQQIFAIHKITGRISEKFFFLQVAPCIIESDNGFNKYTTKQKHSTLASRFSTDDTIYCGYRIQ